MNAKALAELALKLWGVILLLGAVLSLPSALWTFAAVQGSGPEAALVRATQTGYILNVGVQVLAAFIVLLVGR